MRAIRFNRLLAAATAPAREWGRMVRGARPCWREYVVVAVQCCSLVLSASHRQRNGPLCIGVKSVGRCGAPAGGLWLTRDQPDLRCRERSRRVLMVRRLHPSVNMQELLTRFSSCGTITGCKVRPDPASRKRTAARGGGPFHPNCGGRAVAGVYPQIWAIRGLRVRGVCLSPAGLHSPEHHAWHRPVRQGHPRGVVRRQRGGVTPPPNRN
jgi:hypothetical protein